MLTSDLIVRDREKALVFCLNGLSSFLQLQWHLASIVANSQIILHLKAYPRLPKPSPAVGVSSLWTERTSSKSICSPQTWRQPMMCRKFYSYHIHCVLHFRLWPTVKGAFWSHDWKRDLKDGAIPKIGSRVSTAIMCNLYAEIREASIEVI